MRERDIPNFMQVLIFAFYINEMRDCYVLCIVQRAHNMMFLTHSIITLNITKMDMYYIFEYI